MPTTYLNPLYDHDFPDPFVLKHRGEYWAYASGLQDDGRAFPILHSLDLVTWMAVGGAMEVLPMGHTCYWAPEVTYDNGCFYLYYSVGNEENMEIRVAVAEHPAGPFVDSGHRLTHEKFAIDAHVFQDDDGTRYLFYATDFLEHSRVGTGTVCDRMLDLYTLEGNPQPVTRACYDWQIYDPQRAEKGGMCWHTIEGSFVLKRKGLYYQMFSGGNWTNPSYGVSYAIAREVQPGAEWRQVADGEQIFPILRTIPGIVVGPGHNSVVRGPNNRQMVCVYHRWADDHSGRLLAIDPLDWSGERMLILGPSTGPRPVPLAPTVADSFDGAPGDPLSSVWQPYGGAWQLGEKETRQTMATGRAEARCVTRAPAFLMELSARVEVVETADALYGVTLLGAEGEPVLHFGVLPSRLQSVVALWNGEEWIERFHPLPAGFEPGAFHLLRLEVASSRVFLGLDGLSLPPVVAMSDPGPFQVALMTQDAGAAFSGFALTSGWEQRFEEEASPDALGWDTLGEGLHAVIHDGYLIVESESVGALLHRDAFERFEAVVNARLERVEGEATYGFYPALDAEGRGPLLTLQKDEERYWLVWREHDALTRFPLPDGFDPAEFQQFRFEKEGSALTIRWEEHEIGAGEVSEGLTRFGLYAQQARASFDMVRITVIPERLWQEN